MPDYDDTYIDPRLKKELDEARRLKNLNKKKMASLEDQIICVLISTSFDLKKIQSLTIRKFTKILSRLDHKLHYEIYKLAETSGFVEFKQEISHWMCDLSENDAYSDVKVDFDEFKNKMSKVT